MANSSHRLQRFLLRNRDKGIPNLMLYIVLGSGLIYLVNMANGGAVLYQMLMFDKEKILQGEVWRLVSWLFTDILSSNPLLNILFLYFFYRLGRAVELSIGTLKFNLFYLGGVVLMDTFAMIFCPLQDMIIGQYYISAEDFAYLYSDMAFYLHLSLVLAFATTFPESKFYIFFVIPIYAWVMALVYLVLIGINVFNMCYPLNLMPHALFPLVGLLNYFLFFGKQMPNLLPLSWRAKKFHSQRQNQSRQYQRPASRQPKGKPIQFPNGAAAPKGKVVEQAAYTHRCSVCGRTDVSHPDLEFRYCSRCTGYHCYCQDHIGNHEHITEE